MVMVRDDLKSVDDILQLGDVKLGLVVRSGFEGLGSEAMPITFKDVFSVAQTNILPHLASIRLCRARFIQKHSCQLIHTFIPWFLSCSNEMPNEFPIKITVFRRL